MTHDTDRDFYKRLGLKMVTRFDIWPPKWTLWVRTAASMAFPSVLVGMGFIWVLDFPDRWNHAVGGAAISWALSLAWDVLYDLVAFWPWRHVRHFNRPRPELVVGARIEHHRKATIIPFRKR